MLLDHRVRQARPVHKAIKVALVLLAHKAIKALQDLLALKAIKVLRDLQAPKEQLDQLVLKVRLDQQAQSIPGKVPGQQPPHILRTIA